MVAVCLCTCYKYVYHYPAILPHCRDKASREMAAGFECEFVEEPPKVLQTRCPICLLVLREPYQATCCGKSFCKECIEEVKVRSGRCPTCKTENFFSYSNKGLEQSLYDFEVYCSHESKGCEWRGELRELDKHLNSEPPTDKSLEGCPFTVIKCPLNHTGCEVKLSRKEINTHITDVHSTPSVILEATKIATLKEELESMKKQLEESERENLYLKHRVSDLEQEQAKMKLEGSPTFVHSDQWPVGPGEMFLTDFEQRRKMDDEWYSPPFYTHPRGYKMCLRVLCNGRGSGKGTHVSLFIHLMRGEFDEHLRWPFRGEVTVQVLNQEGRRGHCTKVVHFSDTTSDGVGCRVMEDVVGVASGSGLGFAKFVSHSDLRPKLLKNDCLRLCVSKIKLK